MVRLSDAFKAFGPAATFLFLIAISCMMLVLGRVEPTAFDRLRGAVVDFTTPLLDTLARPVDAVRLMSMEVQDHFDLKAENERLTEEVERLKSWQATARRLADENHDLRGLMSLPADPQATFATARVIADSAGPFIRTVLISAGERDNVHRGNAVATGEGVVGRIVNISNHAARVLLLTDFISHMPVIIQGTRIRAMLVGDNGARPRLEFLPSTASVNVGDRVVTSGDGGLVPEGLPVGIVSSVEGHIPRIDLYADLERLDFVRIFRFSMPLEIEDRPPSVIPPPVPPVAAGAAANTGAASAFLTPPMVPMMKLVPKSNQQPAKTPADDEDPEIQE